MIGPTAPRSATATLRRHAAALSIAFATMAPPSAAQAESYYFVHPEGAPLGPGAFMAVCVDTATAKQLLNRHVAQWKAQEGVDSSAAAAAERLPFFGAPALIATSCYEDFTARFNSYYPGRSLTVQEITD